MTVSFGWGSIGGMAEEAYSLSSRNGSSRGEVEGRQLLIFLIRIPILGKREIFG